MRTTRLVVAIAVCFIVPLGFAPSAAPALPSEYQIKAAFLFNFAQFVEWPSASFRDPATPFAIGILGDDPFGPTLDQIVQGESIGSRKLTIRRSRRLDDLKSCQLVFVGRSEQEHLRDVLDALGNTPVLTVSDIDGFASSGGMIGFYLDQNRIRFEINPQRAQKQGLKLSSQLLSLGRIRSGGGAP